MEANSETLVMAGCLLYPDLVQKLLEKVGKQQWTSVLKKSYFEGYQAKAWQEICQHALFAEVDEDMLAYEWVTESDESGHQAVKDHIYSIFIERSSILFQ
jgi:hypothetical protein